MVWLLVQYARQDPLEQAWKVFKVLQGLRGLREQQSQVQLDWAVQELLGRWEPLAPRGLLVAQEPQGFKGSQEPLGLLERKAFKVSWGQQVKLD